ncbi:MAG: hypothetical protein JRJ87_24870 [Deltaproteobacteria bacterium]|nr:hypothetical protein [Deltaproteobacteria bacterium]
MKTGARIKYQASPDDLVIEIDEFCIETSARRLHQYFLEEILAEQSPGPELETACELLRQFLEQEDFATIRSNDNELVGHQRARVRIFRDQCGRVRWAKL